MQFKPPWRRIFYGAPVLKFGKDRHRATRVLPVRDGCCCSIGALKSPTSMIYYYTIKQTSARKLHDYNAIILLSLLRITISYESLLLLQQLCGVLLLSYTEISNPLGIVRGQPAAGSYTYIIIILPHNVLGTRNSLAFCVGCSHDSLIIISNLRVPT